MNPQQDRWCYGTFQRTGSGCGAHRLGFAGVSQSWKSTSEIAIS